MKALTIDKNSHTEFVDIPEAVCGDNDVLIDVQRVGLCGSDLNTYRGFNPLVVYPCIPGHEISGEVIRTGCNVTTAKPGDRVVVLPCTECGVCSSCLAGRPNACKHNQTLGVQRQGDMAQRLVIPANKILVCNALSFDELALVEPLAVGLHAARRGAIQVGEWVAVIGCGVIGLGAIAAAAAMGARVIAIDIDDRKQAVALACGACSFLNGTKVDLADELGRIDEGRGPALVIEAAGQTSSIEQSLELVAFSGRIVYVGYAKKPVNYNSALFLLKEVDIRGSRNATVADFRAVLALMEQQRYPLHSIITTHYPLDQAGEAFIAWAADPGAVTKILIAF
ncbi:zinc-binding alcohol dehydrogenase family protein [Serratia liquefaciens]|uniref:zinc-binding alcohol dehydrogenase family protein n=1 Tax=Serratia liquefaciens TaxID=614 RepID=UPI0018D6089F|nr:zinc-binding alcohol dehydrogenase family protein [Serratia liquefaciens]MBH2811391.1 zinc-binding alcohol dehydrogenase family protein [Serratia liquefaciens]